MNEEEQWREEFLTLERKDHVSHPFLLQVNTLINQIKTAKKKKIQILNSRIGSTSSRAQISRISDRQYLKLSDQLEIELIEKGNLERILNEQSQIISKYKMENTFMEQELIFYKKDENVLKNINNLMVTEVNVLNKKIGYYNQQIDQTWTSLIKRGANKKIEPEVQQKKPSIIFKVEEQKKKPRVTFPDYFAEKSFQISSQSEQQQQYQQQLPLAHKLISQLLLQPLVIEQPQTPPLSKYQLKQILSCITSIHNLPSRTDTWSLTKQQISIYTKSKIMQYFNTSLPFPSNSLYSLVIQKYNTLRQSIQHLQQQYMLFEQSKKQYEQKLQQLENTREQNTVILKRESSISYEQEYQAQTNTIILIIVSLKRLIQRHIGIIDSMLGVVRRGKEFVIEEDEPSGFFDNIRKRFNKIKQDYFNDNVANIINKNYNKVEGKTNDRLKFILLSPEERENGEKLKMERIQYTLTFFFNKYLEIQQLIKDGKKEIDQSAKNFVANRSMEKQKRNLETYYIQTPDYYRIDNYRLLQKMDRKNRKVIVSTARLQRKGSTQQKQETTKTQSQTQRVMLPVKQLQRLKTVRQFRSTVSTQNRNRLQITYSKAFTLSNIVKKISRLNRPLSTFRMSK